MLLEINASPERLDLSAPLIRAGQAKGCKFVISTDAHQPKHLANMQYGVRMARRGWLEAGRRREYTLRPPNSPNAIKRK